MADLFLTLTGADDKIKAHKIGAAGAKHHPVEGRPTAAERAAFQKKGTPHNAKGFEEESRKNRPIQRAPLGGKGHGSFFENGLGAMHRALKDGRLHRFAPVIARGEDSPKEAPAVKHGQSKVVTRSGRAFVLTKWCMEESCFFISNKAAKAASAFLRQSLRRNGVTLLKVKRRREIGGSL